MAIRGNPYFSSRQGLSSTDGKSLEMAASYAAQCTCRWTPPPVRACSGSERVMSVTRDDAQQTVPERPEKLLVVGIGASAGGITALKQFFTHVTPDRNVAYVVILHLSPSHDSKLAEILQMTVTLPVTQVTDPVPIRPDHVYVIPPNKSLAIEDGALVVSEITRVEQRRAPVDVFFRALADAHGSHAVCVILSGTGANGSAGLKRIKEHGGLAIAQDPNQAEYIDMPSNAIATGLIDVVLPVEEIPKKIGDYHLRLRTLPEHSGDAAPDTDDASALRDILTLLKVRTGHDFSNYKPTTLLRRIHRRMTVAGLPTIDSYARWVQEQTNEPATLLKELLISVTHFFRDAEAFTLLEQWLIPRLFTSKAPQKQVRIWVPGCATGEEAYSIAMLLCEYLDSRIDQPSAQIFATDLDEESLAIAREGFFGAAGIVDISEARLDRFFQRETSGYRIRRELREMVLFAHHNLVKDPPFSHLDLDLVPQSPHLSQQVCTGPRHGDVPLRAAAGWLSPARPVRITRGIERSLHHRRPGLPRVPEPHGHEPARAPRVLRGRRASHPASRAGTAARRTLRAARRPSSAPGGVWAAVPRRERRPHDRSHVADRGALPADGGGRAVTRPDKARTPRIACRLEDGALSERKASYEHRSAKPASGNGRRRKAHRPHRPPGPPR